MAVQSITITGVDGFVGRHLANAARRHGLSVTGVSRALRPPEGLRPSLDRYFSTDLTEDFPEDAVSDAIVHLAGLAAVGPSFVTPQLYLEANSSMVTNICETILRCGAEGRSRVIAVSSGAMYAPTHQGTPISEEAPIAFSSPYVVSKVLVENQMTYYRSRGIQAVVARPFNHIGPGQRAGFLVPDLWSRLEKLRPNEALQVGNIATARDYLDVRDVAEAYIALALDADNFTGIVNVCSGEATTGERILELLCQAANVPVPPLSVQESMSRPNDPIQIVGSPAKLMSLTNWQHQFSVADSLRDFIAFARQPHGQMRSAAN